MKEVMFCPLSYGDGSKSPKICRDSCMWYNPGLEACAMHTIAAEIERVVQDVGGLRVELHELSNKIGKE